MPYTLERCRKAHAACMTLAAGAKTPIERNYWARMQKQWHAQLADVRRSCA